MVTVISKSYVRMLICVTCVHDGDGLIQILFCFSFPKIKVMVRISCHLYYSDVQSEPATRDFNDMTIEAEQVLFGLKKPLDLGAISGKDN